MNRRWKTPVGVLAVLSVLIHEGIAKEQNSTEDNLTIVGISKLPDAEKFKIEIEPVLYHVSKSAQTNKTNVHKRDTICEKPSLPPDKSEKLGCVAAFLVDQLKQNNENMNRLLKCLKKNGSGSTTPKPTTQCLRFEKEYIPEESEEFNHSWPKKVKCFPFSRCRLECDSVEITSKSTKQRKTTRSTTKRPTTKKPCKKSSEECECLYCSEDDECVDSN
ncbi:uncharacterized protein LOC129779857 [Toxorhynchites rutilus septentrionalis]|uniref:uncharacterized protein LOC129779857 n=1 Tax=Toxorhynchites rutilus septentrionalis TaxID=329112 RepID=UPI00247A52DB|nr:uncharacterized protein LOC129779857 [Toxorhynchites rutilus septentrionalis]